MLKGARNCANCDTAKMTRPFEKVNITYNVSDHLPWRARNGPPARQEILGAVLTIEQGWPPLTIGQGPARLSAKPSSRYSTEYDRTISTSLAPF